MNTDTLKIVEMALDAIVFLALIGIVIRSYWLNMHRNEALKNEFLTIVAHKFRTPLTHIKWTCDDLKALETDSYKKESWQTVENSNATMINLVNTLIELADSNASSIKSYDIERLSLSALVKGLTDMYKDDFHRKNIFFSVKCDEEETMVKADKNRLEFVIQSILENALIYTPTGHNVDVSVGRLQNRAAVVVKDDGIGIEAKDMDYIFTKFFRAKNATLTDTEGIGVSLSMARSILKRLHGKIEVYSPGTNQGTIVTIKLPISKR